MSKEFADKISELIQLLNPIEDAIVIGLLQLKINKLRSFFEISEGDIDRSRSKSHMHMLSFATYKSPDYNRLQKLKKIIANNRCYGCKFSVPQQETLHGKPFTIYVNDTTDRCNRCHNKTDLLKETVDEIESNIKEGVYSVTHSDQATEIYKCKALIKKIDNRIKTLMK